MQAQHRQLLLLDAVGRHLATAAEEDEAIRAVPVLDHVVLAITRVDRLGRSLADLIKIADELRQRDVSLYIAQQNIDTATPMGQMFYAMLGVFAEFEYHLKRERQVEGIARAKTAGRYKGRKPLDAIRIADIRRMRADGLRPADIARQLRVGRTSVYKYLDGIHLAAEQSAT